MEWLDSLIDRDHCLYIRPREAEGIGMVSFVGLSFRGLALS